MQLAIDHHRRGYVIALTWHATRPFDKGLVSFKEQTQGAFSKKQWGELVKEGSEMHRLWLAQVDSIADYLKTLQEAGVPVLWRPFHEMNGEWFVDRAPPTLRRSATKETLATSKNVKPVYAHFLFYYPSHDF